MKKDIRSFTYEELENEMKTLGLPRFRTGQIYRWLHVSLVSSFDEMTDLPKALRAQLDDNFVIFGCTIEMKLVSEYDGTVKYLFALNDGEVIETVLMKYKYGYTVCVSSQIGCRMGCRFCASTLGGVVRSLLPSEILGQVYAVERDNDIRVSHIVMMGMGEPLDNFENVKRFLSLITDEKGQNISMRHISLSTCGIVPKIYELMEMNLQLTLSVSLHAPNDEIRSSMMPVNNAYNIEKLLEACRKYAKTTSRRISFEYALVRGVNDSPECAAELASRLGRMLCHVNLIPVNAVKETHCRESYPETVKKFAEVLLSKGIPVTVRRKLGADINAACGQLRRSRTANKSATGEQN